MVVRRDGDLSVGPGGGPFLADDAGRQSGAGHTISPQSRR